MFGKRQKPSANNRNAKPLSREAMSLKTGVSLRALESRYLLDAAAVATFADAAGSEVAASQADLAIEEMGLSTPTSIDPALSAVAEMLNSAADFVSAPNKTDLVFIDAGVSDAATLLQNIPSTADIIVVNANESGIAQIAETLAQYDHVDSIGVLATIDGEAMALGSDSFLSDASMNDDGSLATLVGDVLGEGGEVRLHGGGEGANADIEQSAVEQLSILTGVPVTIGSGNGGDPAATPEGADESAADGVEGPVLTDTLETAQDYKFLIATDIRHQSVSAPSLAFSAPSSTASDDARADLLETVDQPESAPDAELETRLSDRQPDMTPVFLTARDTNAGANDGVTGDILIDPGLVAPIATLTAPALQSQTQSPLQSQAQSQSQSQSQIPARDPQDEFGDLIAAAADGVAQGRTEIVFVDTSVNGYQTLVDGLPENVEVVLIGRDVDGVEQIAAYLDGRTDVDAIHIISHGDVGNVSLGTADLNKE
ncbi:MAG: DUF4347 domain-containing protein, partial [Pseudomonadota bacterium]